MNIPDSGVYRSSLSEKLHSSNLIFKLCNICNLIFLVPTEREINYSARERGTARQLPSYQQNLLGKISAYCEVSNHLIEVGANDGTFLKMLSGFGFSNCTGIEPAKGLSSDARSHGLRIKTAYLSEETAIQIIEEYGPASLVISRHTLEHVIDPASFIRASRVLIEKLSGYLLLEVPDAEYMVRECRFWELWDEHNFYFNQGNLARLLIQNKFQNVVAETYEHIETRNIVVTAAIKNAEKKGEDECNIPYSNSGYEKFLSKLSEFKAKLLVQLTKCSGPLYLVGASHPQCNFVNYLELGDKVTFMIDDDPTKIGKFPPIKDSGAQIICTKHFAENAKEGTVLLTGFGYREWSRVIADIAIKKNMYVLDPLTIMKN